MAPFITSKELELSLGLSLSISTRSLMSPMINRRMEVEKTRKRSNPNPNPSYFGLATLSVLPVQFVPAIDGYGFPCIVPFPVGLVPHLPFMHLSSDPNDTGVRRLHSWPPSESYSDSHDQGGGSSSCSNKDSSQSIHRKKQKLQEVKLSVKLSQVPSENSISSKTNETIDVKLDDNTDKNNDNNSGNNNNNEALMALVSTRGDGPNGTRTIYGHLKRCRRTDGTVISIECVCHGSSFSPAEFVRHAGGTETANPLRSIVVSSKPSRS